MPGLRFDALTTDINLIHAGKFRAACVVGHESCSLKISCRRLMRIEAHDFMPDLKVGRFMPVVVDNTTLLFCRRRMKLLVTTEANLRTNLSSLTISFKSPLFTLLCFYKLQLPFPRSASKNQSHIQSTVRYIF